MKEMCWIISKINIITRCRQFNANIYLKKSRYGLTQVFKDFNIKNRDLKQEPFKVIKFIVYV